MKGSFSTKVSDAVKSMQPIPLALLLDDAYLLEADSETPSYNGSSLNSDIHGQTSQSALQFPTPTPPVEFDHSELRKRLGVGAAGAAGAIGAVGAGAGAEVDAHEIPYGEQTGPTKYAPMPKMAGTTIADKSPTPQYPPFPFVKATTYLPAPTVQYTDTAYLTFTTHSIENTVCLTPSRSFFLFLSARLMYAFPGCSRRCSYSG